VIHENYSVCFDYINVYYSVVLVLFSIVNMDISLICDKSVTAQSLAFLGYWYRKKRLQVHF